MNTQREGIDVPGHIDDDGNPRAGNPSTAPAPTHTGPATTFTLGINCYGANFEDDALGRVSRWRDDPRAYVLDRLWCAIGPGKSDTTPEIDSVMVYKPSGRDEGEPNRLYVLPTTSEHIDALAWIAAEIRNARRRAILYTGVFVDGRADGPTVFDDQPTLSRLLSLGFDEIYLDNSRHVAMRAREIQTPIVGVEPTLDRAHSLHQVAYQAAAWAWRDGVWHQPLMRGHDRRIRIIVDGRKRIGEKVLARAMDDADINDLVRRGWKLATVARGYAERVLASIRRGGQP